MSWRRTCKLEVGQQVTQELKEDLYVYCRQILLFLLLLLLLSNIEGQSPTFHHTYAAYSTVSRVFRQHLMFPMDKEQQRFYLGS